MPYTQVTLSELRSRLQAKFESVPFFTVPEQNIAINDALQWYNLLTGVWRQRVTLPTVSGQVYYDLPAAMLYNTRMECNGVPLNQSAWSDLDNGRPGWEAERTSGLPSAWVPVGMNRFALWPAPTGVCSLTIDGVEQTPVLTADTDTVDLDDSEIDALLGEALAYLCFKDPGRRPRVENWHTNFLQNAMDHSSRLRAANPFLSVQGTDQNRQTTPVRVR